MEEGWEPLEIGRGELLADGDDLLIVAYGAMVAPAMATAGLLQEQGVRAAVINARFLRPLDQALILPMAQRIGRGQPLQLADRALHEDQVEVPPLRDRRRLVLG